MRNLIASVALLTSFAAMPVVAAEFPATLVWADRTALSLPISGLVKDVKVRAGQDVPAGGLLLEMDARPFDARLHKAQAGVLGLERKRVEAKNEAKRAQELYARTVLSNVELEKAHIDQQQVESQYQEARAQQQLIEVERSYSQLKAPFAARVLAVNVAPGEAISAAMQAPTLIEVARSNVIDVVAKLKPEEVAGLKLGGKVDVEVNVSKVSGEIIAIESPKEGGYRIVVRVLAAEGWLAGLSAKIITP